jgi:hypothetical protein
MGMMSKSVFFFTGLLLLLSGSCDYSRYKYDFFEGNWVLQNYFDTVQKYRSGVYATETGPQELVFKRHVDSVCIYSGHERSGVVYAFERKSSNNILIHAGKPLSVFITKSAKQVKYEDGGRWLSFVKPAPALIDSSINHVWPFATQRVLNRVTLAGVYRIRENAREVRFFPDGTIKGLPGFHRYRVDYGTGGGNGFEGDQLIMQKKEGAQSFTWEWEGSTLRLYALEGHTAGLLAKGALFVTLERLK